MSITIKTKWSTNSKSNIAYLNYISTREGVITLDKSLETKSPSEKQLALIKQLTKDDVFYDGLKELNDFKINPNMLTANKLISKGLDYALNVDNEVYLNYISTREGVVVEPTTSQDGLFDLKGKADLTKYKEMLPKQEGKIYKMIISLPYESDFREKDKWEQLIRSSHNNIAKAFKKNPSNIEWVGAVHEASNPHVHLMIWSNDGKSLELNKTEFVKSMEDLKVTFGNKIYADDFKLLNEQRDILRKNLNVEMKKHLKNFNSDIAKNGLNQKSLDLIEQYKNDIPNVKYGYQKIENKEKINKIVESIIKDNPHIDKMFEALVDNQKSRLDIYNVSKEEDIDKRLEVFKNKLLNPQKNDRPILQNIVIDEINNFPVKLELDDVIQPKKQEIDSPKNAVKDNIKSTQSTNVVEPTTNKKSNYYSNKLGLHVGRGLLRALVNEGADFNNAERESFIQSNKTNRENTQAHRLNRNLMMEEK